MVTADGRLNVSDALPATARFAEREQNFSIPTEFHDLVAFAVFAVTVGDPDIVFFVDVDAVRKYEPAPKLRRSWPSRLRGRGCPCEDGRSERRLLREERQGFGKFLAS